MEVRTNARRNFLIFETFAAPQSQKRFRCVTRTCDELLRELTKLYSRPATPHCLARRKIKCLNIVRKCTRLAQTDFKLSTSLSLSLSSTYPTEKVSNTRQREYSRPSRSSLAIPRLWRGGSGHYIALQRRNFFTKLAFARLRVLASAAAIPRACRNFIRSRLEDQYFPQLNLVCARVCQKRINAGLAAREQQCH